MVYTRIQRGHNTDSLRSFDVPTHLPELQQDHSSESVATPAFLRTSSCSLPLESPIHSGALASSHLASADAASFPRMQRVTVPIAPFYSQGPPHYAGGFLAVPENPRDPPAPRLRPASWGPPEWIDGGLEGHPQTRSRSSVDYRGGSSGEEEDLPFGGRTLPPLPALDDLWCLGARPTPNVSSTLSRDHSPASEDLSVTSSLPSTSVPTTDQDGEYRRVMCSSSQCRR